VIDRRKKSLKKLALRLEQNRKYPLYLLSLTASELLAVAEVARLSRSAEGKLLGYQRGEVRRHIQDIVAYLDSDDILFPNSIIIAFGTQVTFKPLEVAVDSDDAAVAGTLAIPVHRQGEQKAGWIVDGQQRTAALNQSVRSALPVPVSAFVADDTALQRDQFLRVNNTRPLPRGLITEFLPEVAAPLPRKLAGKRLPSALCDLLNRDSSSPFHGLIRRASTPAADRRRAVIADASVVMMLEESLYNPAGCLFPYNNLSTSETDLDGLWSVLTAYWSAVRETFPEAWGRPPSESRLMHGTGIRAMGRLMDRMLAGSNPRDPDLRAGLRWELRKVAPFCRWTAGRWEELDLDWREVQNVPQHLRLLSTLLVRAFHTSRGGLP
jgi:DGQHR domain-containing protein